MTLYLDAPTPADLHTVLAWRKTCPESLRTPREITPPEQEQFYNDVIANRDSRHRYYAVRKPCDEGVCQGEFVALGSLEHISWENGSAEIGLLVDPARQGQGIGMQAVDLVLAQAFNQLRLATVFGEAYQTGTHVQFWQKVIARHRGTAVDWPRRKFWHGTLYDATLFTITEPDWRSAGRYREYQEKKHV